MQSSDQNKYEADTGEDAVAYRSTTYNFFAYDVPARPPGYSSSHNERHREGVSPNMKHADDVIEERPTRFWNRVYAAVILTTVVVVTLLWAFSRYFS